MINVKRLTVISLCAASTCVGNAMPQTQETAIGTQQQDSTQTLPAQWNLQACIDYALQQNITIRKNRLNAESAEVDGQAGIQELAGDATMLYYMTEEAQEGGKAFLEKRKPRFQDYPKFP